MHQNQEFENLLSLLKSNISENVALGLVVAQNYQKEFKRYFGCDTHEYEEMIDFLKDSVSWNDNPSVNYKKQIIKTKKLDLEFSDIYHIPKGIWQLKNLKLLILDHNYLIYLPKQIGQLQNLETLFLSFNQITEIPKEIGQLKNLQMLDFESNKIKYLPVEIVNLKKLKLLQIKDNYIKSIPDEIKAIQHTQGLKIYADYGLL